MESAAPPELGSFKGRAGLDISPQQGEGKCPARPCVGGGSGRWGAHGALVVLRRAGCCVAWFLGTQGVTKEPRNAKPAGSGVAWFLWEAGRN